MVIRYVAGVAVLLSACSVTAHAESAASVIIPEKVTANILKRHPRAEAIQASFETHFGLKLLEVAFKTEGGEQVQELFTENGHLFTNELMLDTLAELSPEALAALKQQFPNYQLKKAELVTNPNGVGQEYEIYLHSGGSDWKISVNDKGTITQQDSLP